MFILLIFYSAHAHLLNMAMTQSATNVRRFKRQAKGMNFVNFAALLLTNIH